MKYDRIVYGLAVTLVFVLACHSVRADEAGKAMADTMIKAYQNAKTYQGKWLVLKADTANERMDLNVAVDRKTGQILVRMQPQTQKDKVWVTQPGGQLVIRDGDKLHKAIYDGQKWGTSSVDSPKDFSYRDIRRSLVLFSLVDLPVLLSDHPLEEWLQGEVGEAMILPPDPKDEKKQPRLKVGDTLKETEITIKLDPITHLVVEAVYGPVRFELVSVVVDKPLVVGTFDFESTWKAMQTVK